MYHTCYGQYSPLHHMLVDGGHANIGYAHMLYAVLNDPGSSHSPYGLHLSTHCCGIMHPCTITKVAAGCIYALNDSCV